MPAGMMRYLGYWTLRLVLLSILASSIADDIPPNAGDTNSKINNNAQATAKLSDQGMSLSKQNGPKEKLRVVTIDFFPYTNITTDSNGNKTFTGFIPDLLKILEGLVGVEIKLYESPDNRWGGLSPDGTWNGMIGEVTKRTGNNPETTVGADFAAAPMAITSKRSRVVNFVHPFQNLGLTVLVKKAYLKDNQPDVGPFPSLGVMNPFSGAVWAVVLVGGVVVALLMWMLNHFNPYEWGGRYNLGLVTEQHKESFNFSGSLWFVFTTLQWQGFERAPRSIAGKLLTCFWFMFVTLTLVAYTGALVNQLWWASMTKTHSPAMKHPFYDVRDLVTSGYKFGIIQKTSGYRTIEDGSKRNGLFRKMMQYWETDEGKDQVVDSLAAGLEKVRNEDFALIVDEMRAEQHIHSQPCDLVKVGDSFGSTSFGFAFPLRSAYTARFNLALLQLRETHEVQRLEDKWWRGTDACWNYTMIERLAHKAQSVYMTDSRPKPVDMSMFMGPMGILIVGVVLGLLVGLAEILYYRYKGRYDTNNRPQGHTLKLDNDEGNI